MRGVSWSFHLKHTKGKRIPGEQKAQLKRPLRMGDLRCLMPDTCENVGETRLSSACGILPCEWALYLLHCVLKNKWD